MKILLKEFSKKMKTVFINGKASAKLEIKEEHDDEDISLGLKRIVRGLTKNKLEDFNVKISDSQIFLTEKSLQKEKEAKRFLIEGRLDEEGFIFFWRPQDENAYLGNWWISPFELDGQSFNCAEQAMMWKKALLMEDEVIAEKILAVENPARHKRLGRQIKNWNEDLWSENRCEIMYTVCRAKFEQNEDLLEQLLATGNAILAEASPRDKIWGIGLASTSPSATKQDRWKGLNLLGRVLMAVREDLR